METLRVGTIVNTFGIKGELKVKIITDFPEERFQPEAELFVMQNGKQVTLTVKSCRYHKNHALLLFEGLEDINLVEQYNGLDLFIPKETAQPLTEGHYAFDLIGMQVYQKQQLIGVVKDVEAYPAHSILRVKTTKKDVLIPFVEAFIEEVNQSTNSIHIHAIEGLL